MSSVVVGVMVSRRPEWVAHGLASAARIADLVVYRYHTAGDFADVFNDALAEAAIHAPVALKVDDHDTYPDDHATILSDWQPGVTVWGRCDFVTCQGVRKRRSASMCASALPTDLRLEPDRHGALTSSLRRQTQAVEVDTGVVKRICEADWSWGQRSPLVACGCDRKGS